jgi:hypothetical protein
MFHNMLGATFLNAAMKDQAYRQQPAAGLTFD